MSGSGTLWATASKEWIIQPKPKPGRKPNKDQLPSGSGQEKDEPDGKGRRIQNRAAQRAFRERKQSQLAELQARILAYEQGEIERNVALQTIAKRLKEENGRLLQENQLLKERLAELQEQQQQPVTEKRSREESPLQSRPLKKRSKMSSEPATVAPQPSPPPEVLTPDPTVIVEGPFSHSPYTFPHDASTTTLNDILDFSTEMKDANIDPIHAFHPFGCGFCSENTLCVCRDVLSGFKGDGFVDAPLTVDVTNTVVPVSGSLPEPAQDQPSTSILENLPAYQPPVPLRRRPGKSSKPIFPIFTAPVHPPPSNSEVPISVSGPTCSGDPSNCAACNDDAFGKAFCSAIGETAVGLDTCDNCPSKSAGSSATSGGGCCGNPLYCKGCPLSPQAPDIERQYYIPTNAAWKQIKAHPNVEFADLALLAEVVASRSKCAGPQIAITPPPDRQPPATNPDCRSKEDSAYPRLVPQELLLECGRRRVREVHPEAVRDALRLLDAKFT